MCSPFSQHLNRSDGMGVVDVHPRYLTALVTLLRYPLFFSWKTTVRDLKDLFCVNTIYCSRKISSFYCFKYAIWCWKAKKSRQILLLLERIY